MSFILVSKLNNFSLICKKKEKSTSKLLNSCYKIYSDVYYETDSTLNIAFSQSEETEIQIDYLFKKYIPITSIQNNGYEIKYSGKENITTKYKTFENCIHIILKSSNYDYHYFYKENYGLIAKYWSFNAGSLNLDYEIVNLIKQ